MMAGKTAQSKMASKQKVHPDEAADKKLISKMIKSSDKKMMKKK